ncbi:FMN-binding negative transcriptional regulator [Acidisphaera sp. L21]|uniref:FMN-binding negative transcriptional regulator n=1 Tax=Acidisphaera sp. L21 TaxID=1641851 RepID=UPI00131B7B52|nr:FMN-binding negative transcriptional regulator [Acidisphaera sp. L21]
MYLRPAFHQTDPTAIRALIHSNPFAQIVTTGPRGMEASHIPVLLVEQGDDFVLAAHFAAGNPQCAAIGDGADALLIFSGAHAYISPGWYETQPSVPTWDFAAVHVYGPLVAITDHAAIATDIQGLAAYDPHRFDVMHLASGYRERMFAGIRAFRMNPTRVEGQWKMSQNRSQTDRRRVIAALRGQGDELSTKTAAMIQETLLAGADS